ncbi:glycine-rich domain-containing protein [Kitasatospora sp. NPDC057904]|uniref:glycine-rich domain-containing protein n=1 Tax=unclassified Kitasatospora TaxID=2633591 RepID=UPI0036D12AF7
MRDYIFGLDFGLIKWNLMNPAVGSQLPISQDKADFSETLYKRWLFLRRKHEGESMPPSADIDEFWHAHILDTFAYTEHCDRIFGYYFHHYPYFGTRGKADEQALYQAWDNTMEWYQAEFGEPLYQYD